ncbi:MAG: hypothetical protein P1V20_29250 [Verrucomicrobiales bacterium]|nr:hypothetical protein [Verrucomicrobiales bacterium]
MPNWCSNYIEISASKEAVSKLCAAARAPSCPGSKTTVEFSFLPFVEHLLPDDYENNIGETNYDLIGCKWFPQFNHMDHNGDQLHISFETPWGPSENATRHLAAWLEELDPEFQIIHSYEETGMAFCGLLEIDKNGERSSHGDRYEIDCAEINTDDDIDLECIISTFEISAEEIHKAAAGNSEYGYLAFYPEFFEDYGASAASLYLPLRKVGGK